MFNYSVSKKVLMVLMFSIMISVCVSAATELVLVTKGTLPSIGNGVLNITADYFIGKYEVTQSEFQAAMGTNPSNFKGEKLPADSITWDNAVKYCNKLSEIEKLPPFYAILGIETRGANRTEAIVKELGGKGYRLPTKEEWEYAARGGDKSKGFKYSGSNTVGDVAWFRDNSGGKTQEVGKKAPNELGIYDMSGNVLEWTNNVYNETYRVYCGGGWSLHVGGSEVKYWYYGYPGYQYNDLGFRVVRTK